MIDLNEIYQDVFKGIIGWFVVNIVVVNFLMIVVLFGGIFGYFQFNCEVFFSVVINGVMVLVVWLGVLLQEVEEQIIVCIEEVLIDIDGVDMIILIVVEGSGFINIEGKFLVDIFVFIDEIKLNVDFVNNLL